MAEHPGATRTRTAREDAFPWNIVVMGMGEPLLNYEDTVAALRILMDPEGFAIAAAQADALDGRHPAGAREAGAGAGAAEPGDQPARPRPGAAARADADRGKVRARRRARRRARYPSRAAAASPSSTCCSAGVNDARATPASWPAGCAGKRGKVNLIPLNPAPGIPFEAPAEAVRPLLRESSPSAASPSRCAGRAARTCSLRAGSSISIRAGPPSAPCVRPARPVVERASPLLRALLLGTLALLLPSLDAAPIKRAEIYFLDAARAMVERGDFVVPCYRGEPFFDKPVLTYWVKAWSYGAAGA